MAGGGGGAGQRQWEKDKKNMKQALGSELSTQPDVGLKLTRS